jgi:outer membrane protein TolC
VADRLQHAGAPVIGPTVPGRYAQATPPTPCPRAPGEEAYGDPVLSDLIRRAARENRDVRIAAQRVQAARAGVTISRSF